MSSNQGRSRQETISNYYGHIARTLFASSWYKDPTIAKYISNAIPVGAIDMADLCSGTGSLVRSVLRGARLQQYDMIDISPEVCALARADFAQDKRVSVLRGDWIKPATMRGKRYDVILIKNSLHLIENLRYHLNLLRAIARPATKVIIIETVSPTVRANRFVKELFRNAGLAEYKVHYFTSSSLKRIITSSNLVIKREKAINQSISVESWLIGKQASGLRQRMVKQFIRTSIQNDPSIQEEMNIIEVSFGGDVKLLRRQLCLEVLLPP